MFPQPSSREFTLAALVTAERDHPRWLDRISPEPDALLAAFLQHAARTVPAYRSRLDAKDGPPRLDAFSPISKDDVVATTAGFTSDAFETSTLHVKTTSGTTGTPLAVARDPVSWYGFAYDSYRAVASVIPVFAAGLERGETGVLFLNDNPIRSPWTVVNPSLRHAKIQKVVLGRDADEDEKIVGDFRRKRPPLLYGRPRTLLRLAELDGGGDGSDRIRPNAILSSGDNLYDDDRRRLETCFGALVHNAYATMEGGFIAVECPHRTGLHVFPKRARVEVLRPDGTIASTGDGECLVTNLENWAMPFVRYRTGDSLVLTEGTCDCGHAGVSITGLSGRDSTAFVVRGKTVPPSYFNSRLEQLPVQRFQIVQDGVDELSIQWVPRRDCVDVASVERSIREFLTKDIGARRASVEAVETLGPAHDKQARFVTKKPAQ